MRLTRAAQRAQEGPEQRSDQTGEAETVDTAHVVEAANMTERAALNNISTNASPKQVNREEEELPVKTPVKTPAKKSKGKAGSKKSTKGKKGKAAEEKQEKTAVDESLGDEQVAAAALSTAGDPAIDGLSKHAQTGTPQFPLDDERPATETTQPTRLTRRQLAAMQEEELKKSQHAAALQPEAEVAAETPNAATKAQASDSPNLQREPTPVLEESRIKVLEVSHDEDLVAPGMQPTEPSQPEIAFDTEQAELDIKLEPLNGIGKDVVVVLKQPTKELVVPESHVQEPTNIAPSVEIATGSARHESPQAPQLSQPDASPKHEPMAADQPNEPAMSPEIQTPSRRRASRSPSKSPMRIEESLEAIDALEEALDSLDAVTNFDHTIEEKSPRKKALSKSTQKTEVRAKTPKKPSGKFLGKTLSKAPIKEHVVPARISRVPSGIPTGMKATKTSLARTSSVRSASTKEIRKGSTETVDYLASKRRPISVSFPTPPPPPKGRAPTKATFQLSSDNVVAKLKAQKEERAKRDAEGPAPKQRPISMPPQTKSTKPLTKPTFQLPGEKTAEKLKAQKEERLKKQAEAPRQSMARPVCISVPSMPPKPVRPATKPTNFQLPGAAVAEKLKLQKEERLKRQEEAEAMKRESSLKPRTAPVRTSVTLSVRAAPGVTIPPPSQTQTSQQRSTSITSKRNSIMVSQPRSTSTSSTNQNTTVTSVKTTVPPLDSAAQRIKGKEVFNREKMDKEARERERTEKEHAAKKARAEAAERGRIASREWAERQRKKMMAA